VHAANQSSQKDQIDRVSQGQNVPMVSIRGRTIGAKEFLRRE